MKRINTLYYLLFVLIIFGAFASMAQNDYGIKLLGLVASTFALIFMIQSIQQLREKSGYQPLIVLELVSLTILAAILSLRVFYIHFPFVEIVFGMAGIILISVYIQKIIEAWRNIKGKSQSLTVMVLLFYGSIISYSISMITVPFLPIITEPTGAAGFLLVIGFALVSIMKKEIMVEGEKVTGLGYVTRFKDKSVMLVALFLLFTSYMGLTKVGIIPKIYSDEYPQAYFELVNHAESGKEKPVNGKYKHEEFKQMYDKFVARNSNTNK